MEDHIAAHRPILTLGDHQILPEKEDNGLHSGEARDGGEEAEERGEEGRDGAVQEAQAGPPQHQQQGQDIEAGRI